MTIRAKTAVAVLTALTCSALVAAFISGTIISRTADEVAQRDAREAGRLLLRIQDREQREFVRLIEDWAKWDDTYEFAQSSDAEYVEKNLDDETLARNRFDVFALVDPNHKLLFSLGYSRKERKRVDPPADLERLARAIPPSLFASLEGGMTGLWAFGDDWYLVGIEAVTTSLYDKPPNAALVIGRSIESGLLRDWEGLTRMSIRQTRDIAAATVPGANSRGVSVESVEINGRATGIVTIPGLLGTAPIVFAVESGSPPSDQSNLDVLLVLVLLVGSGLLIFLVATTSIGRILVHRVEHLHRFVSEVRRTGALDRRVVMAGNDEIAELAASFNSFLDRIGNDVLRMRSGADALKDSLRMIDDIIQNMPVGIVQWRYQREPEGLLFIAANPIAQRLIGVCSADQAGLEFDELFPDIAARDLKELLLSVMRGQNSIDVDELAFPGCQEDRVFHIYAFALPHDRLCVAIEDITHRREAEHERAKLEEQLRQSQKMEAVGRLAGGVAHDFNNILTTIRGYAELLLEQADDRDPTHEDLTEIRDAADRAAQLTAQLLAFSRRQVYSPRDIELNDLLLRSSKMLRRLIGEDIDLSTRVAGVDLHLRADPTQIEQILINLVVNARDAIATSGKIRIQADARLVDEDFAELHADAAIGDYVVISVSDDGAGMDTEVQAKIFEPFFTTKERGKGTGLGLSTVYGIVRQNGGFLVVTSSPGEGSTFEVHLPRASVRGPERDVN